MTGRYKIEPIHVGPLPFQLEFFANFDAVVDEFFEAVASNQQQEKYWPVFGNLWAAARGLAQFLEGQGAALAGRRVLELGCGLGLPSMVASRLGASVLASDFHPEVKDLLERNLERNAITSVTFQRLDWSETNDCGEFDVIMASDILYEPEPPVELIAFLKRHLKHNGSVYIADIGRVYFARFLTMMQESGFVLEASEEMVEENSKRQRVHITRFIKKASS